MGLGPGNLLAEDVLCDQYTRGLIVATLDVKDDLEGLPVVHGDGHTGAVRGAALVLGAHQELAGGFDPGVEGVLVERLGIDLVAAHRPGRDVDGVLVALAAHLDRPATAVLVLDHLGDPALATPSGDQIGVFLDLDPLVELLDLGLLDL